ncbi:MAG: short chain 3-hydroxyacyl-CoA dehydrogenase mitochondrial precursor [Piptocephalis tieghemiana]|nr:MAG: short chain 3-hydroxyacyl-CoA dehydrogenase mitochondrial precursor [Piptocephalis tieghemiana]
MSSILLRTSLSPLLRAGKHSQHTGLVTIRCLSPYSSSFSTSTDIERVTVIGSGLMGSGIAQVVAGAGMQATLVDVSDEALEKGRGIIAASLKRVARKKFPDSPKDQANLVEDTLSRVTLTTNAESAAGQAGLVVEAIVENLEVKKKLFSSLDQIAPASTIFASNTSSLPIADIASATKRPDRFAGLHFFNPVPQMKLVEVIRTQDTSQSTVDSLFSLCHRLKKAPVACSDTPGFIVNRLMVPYMMEAIRLVERGDATPQDVDTAMKYGAGYPMGPFELMDVVGLDTLKFITDGWYNESAALKGKSLAAPSDMLNNLVKQGKYGRKSGEGFFSYTGVDHDKRSKA